MPVLSTLGAAIASVYGFTSGLIKDQYFNLVSLLLPGNGTNGAQNNTFLDSSTNNFTITRNGDTTQGTFSPFSQTGWGAYFDGASDYLQYTNSDFSVSTGDFTAEWWMYVTSDKSQVGIMTASSNANLTIGYGGGSANARRPYVEWGGAGSFIGTMSNYMNSWVHICIMRSSGTVYTFQNGALLDSLSKTAAVGATTNMVIGTNSGDIAAQSFPGYLSNVRFSKAAIYSTSGFTPSTTPLTRTSQGATNVQFLTLQSNRLLDSNGVNTPATSPLAITRNGDVSVTPFSPFAPTSSYSSAAVGGSGYFDGSGDYLTVPDSTALDLPGDFTIECWLYRTANTNNTILYTIGNYSGSNNGFTLYVETGNNLRCYGNGGFIFTGTAGLVPLNAWVHIALIRSGSGSNNMKAYINGVLDTAAQASNNSSWTGVAGNGFSPGAFYDGTYNAQTEKTYMAGMRLVKGQALASGDFTPPTAPVTTSSVGWTGANAAGSLTGTISLLLNFTNAGVVDATAKNVLETEGNAQISTSVSKFGGGSISFDGTSNTGLKAPTGNLFTFGSGAFTIEFWVRFNSVAADQMVLNLTGTTIVLAFYVSATGTLSYYLSSDGSTWNIVSGALVGSISTGQWYRVALVRSGNTFTPYLNTTAGTPTTSSAALATPGSGTFLHLGMSNVSASNLSGYLDDVRVTRGVARDMTVLPTAPFPVQ
jgi:hypothetical protein